MPILKFHPTRHNLVNISYYGSKNLDKMLNYVDSDEYALVQGGANNNSMAYVDTFELPSIPENVILNSYSVLISFENANGFSNLSCNIQNGNTVLSTTAFSCEPNVRTLGSYTVTGRSYSELLSADKLRDLRVHLPLGSGSSKIYGIEIRLDVTSNYNKVVVNKNDSLETLIDLTADTVTPETLLSGYTAHDRTGTIITGTYIPEIPSNYGLITWDGNVLTVS